MNGTDTLYSVVQINTVIFYHLGPRIESSPMCKISAKSETITVLFVQNDVEWSLYVYMRFFLSSTLVIALSLE